jgi:tRNA (guanine37-N1)-methyltransferase
MTVRSFVRVASSQGERVRKILSENELLDRECKPIAEDGMLFFPLREALDTAIMKLLGDNEGFSTGEREFTRVPLGPRTLAEAMVDDLSSEEISLLPRAYDLIGEIAVLEIPKELESHATTIGTRFLEIHPNFTTVLAKQGAISGTTRTREYQLLAGEDTTKTVHIEYGCKFAVDLEKAYFSPRLLEEHNRVASLVQKGELVIDMFCGVGPFAIHIAKRTDAQVIAIDINPEAISLLQQSLKLNKLRGEITPVSADAQVYLSGFEGRADRIIMNHPSGAQEFVAIGCSVLQEGGMLHYYDFLGGTNPERDIRDRITGLVEAAGRSVQEISLVRRIRDSAPYEYQMVADVRVL